MGNNLTFEVAIYLRGPDLDPVHVSNVLGIGPSRSQFRGEKRLSAAKIESVAKIGLWALVNDGDARTVEQAISQVVSKIPKDAPSLLDIDGVDEAYIDVFIAVDADTDGGGSCGFVLSPEQVKLLSSINLPVQFNIGVVRP
jgi:hypothetical protein